MPISIKNVQVETLARQLAEFTGETITEAIGAALKERHDRLRRGRLGQSLTVELNEIALQYAKRPLISTLSADEILGYDERGAPTR